MNNLISKQEAIQRILADRINITAGLLAVGADKAVYEAINATCERHVRMLEEMQGLEIIRCEECANCQIDTVYHDYWCNGKKVWKDHYCGYAGRREDGFNSTNTSESA